MEETGWWRNNLSFRDWEYYDRSPAANFFHPASTEDGIFDRVFYPNRRFAQDEEEIDLYSISPPTLAAATAPLPHKGRKLRQLMQRAEEERSPRRNTTPAASFSGGAAAGEKPVRRNRGSKAVDEDLYKIPSELLYRKPIRKRTSACEFLAKCLRLNCIA